MRERLQETKEPLIGLHYIEEIYPETQVGGKKWEPLYNCNLCCVTGEITSLFISYFFATQISQRMELENMFQEGTKRSILLSVCEFCKGTSK